MNEENKKRAFDKSFEEKIPQAILMDHSWAEQIYEVIVPELFDTLHVRKMVEIIKDYYFRYEKFPSISLMESIINKDVQDILLQKKCIDLINKMKTNPLNGDSDYVKEKSLEWFRLQNISNCLVKDVLPRIESGQNLEDIVSLIQASVNKGSIKDVGYEYVEDEEERFKDDVCEKVSSGSPYLDDFLRGGFGGKRLITILAASGQGKSHLLVNFGKGALLSLKPDGTPRTVLHYTLELDTRELARRYDASITGIKIDDVVGNKDAVLKNIANKIPDGAQLIIKEYPMESASVQTIRSHLARLKVKNITPDIILIDYADLLSPSIRVDGELRHSLSAIYRELKRLAQELRIPILTATQTNRSGYGADIITPDMIGDDWKKVQVSDVLLTYARNGEVGKCFLAKNRQGPDGKIFAFKLDPATCFVDMFELTADVQEQINEINGSAEITKNEDVKNKLADFINKNKKVN